MDSTIIASIIGAIATIISGLIGYFIGCNKKLNKNKMPEIMQLKFK